jgi:hypothetical protein
MSILYYFSEGFEKMWYTLGIGEILFLFTESDDIKIWWMQYGEIYTIDISMFEYLLYVVECLR